MEKLSVLTIADRIQTEADAYAFLEELRWGDAPVCPHCGAEKVYFLNPENGTSRATRTGNKSFRRVWKCGACRKQFSVLTGTIFHGTKISVRKWLFVIFEMCSSKNGVAAREIERKYGLTNKTAWFMLHRIREAMKRGPLSEMMRGTVVADETFIGGRERNKHKSAKPDPSEPRPIGAGYRKAEKQEGLVRGKVAVLALIDTATGEARSQVVPDVTGATLRKAMSEQVSLADTHLMTDEAKAYQTFASEVAEHSTVNHAQDEYVRYEPGRTITTNAAENYFSQLKRSLDGTHHHVSREHLPRYLANFDFMFSTRQLTDSARTQRLIGQVAGRRLTYRTTR